MKFLITGGCRFIGSAVVRRLGVSTPHEVVTTVDKMTCAASEDALGAALGRPRHRLIRADIADAAAIRAAFEAHRPDIVMHLAAESHVDPRSPYAASKAASDHLVRARRYAGQRLGTAA